MAYAAISFPILAWRTMPLKSSRTIDNSSRPLMISNASFES